MEFVAMNQSQRPTISAGERVMFFFLAFGFILLGAAKMNADLVVCGLLVVVILLLRHISVGLS